ncbi:TonB-dependent receptor [Chitinophaga sp. 212800010-3]|uniref:TonB-dependent receptor domain-containing protein n=1 Tax=unclassified Chitinophaga TaxID=2619133 RepID=UPI002DE7A629|nr:Outer membrane receptor protein involved in Fe transport [Chitinophaga sp. 212800010-3]
MKSFFSLLLFTVFYSNTFAQAVLTGTVNNQIHEPIPLALIQLQRSSPAWQQTMQTDSSGRFSFTGLAPGEYQLRVAFTGYQTISLSTPISRDTVIRLIMQPLNAKLNEVTVTSVKAAISNNPDKLVYNVASSITATGSDALTALSQVPGIRISDNEIGIAGKGAVKVMVNGRLLQLTGIDLLRYLKSMAANQVSKIELIKNPGAAYDAEGNAGLINITTKQNRKQGLSGNVQASGKQWLHNPPVVYGKSNYEAVDLSATVDYNNNRWSVYGGINLDQDHHLEGFRTDIRYPHQWWTQSDTGVYTYHNINLTAGADYQLSSKASIGINYQGSKNKYEGSDHVNNPVYNNSGQLDSLMKTFATYYPIAQSHALNLHSTVNFDTSGRRLLLNADYFNYYRTDKSDFESNTYLPNDPHPSGTTRYFDHTRQLINIYTFKADVEYPTAFAKWMFGTKLSFIDNKSNAFYYNKVNGELVFNTDLSNEFDYKENTQALYASMNKESGAWKYEAGLRGELTQTNGYSYTLNQHTPQHYFRLFPSLAVSWQANKSNSLSLTFGRRINRPSFWNLNPYKSLYTSYSYGEGNPFLQPEYNTNAELSHNWKGILTSALFLNITDDGFNSVTIARADTNLVYTKPFNFIKTYRYGFSENIALPFFSWLDNNNQVSVYYTDARSSLTEVDGIKGWGLYLATNNNIWFNKNKTLGGAVNFWYQFPEINHIGRTDASYKLDLGLKASVLQKKMDISLTMSDLFLSSAINVSSIVMGMPQKVTNFQLNRYLMLSLSYRFGGERKARSNDTGNEEEKGRLH